MTDSHPEHYKRGVFQAIVAGVFLSTAGIGIRLIEHATPLQITFYRAVGLAVFMYFFLLIRSGGKPLKPFIETGWIGIFAGCAFAAASWSLIFAYSETSVANVVFIVSLAPFFAAFIGWVVLREKVQQRTWIAIAIAVLGVFIMIRGALSGHGAAGVAYAFAMAIFYALFTVIARMGKQRDMLPAVFWSGVILSIACAIRIESFEISHQDLLICFALAVFQVGIGGLLIVAAAKHVPAAQITFLAMLEVVLSPVWVWLFVNEKPELTTLIGGAVIMLAIAYQALGKSSSAPQAHG